MAGHGCLWHALAGRGRMTSQEPMIGHVTQGRKDRERRNVLFLLLSKTGAALWVFEETGR